VEKNSPESVLKAMIAAQSGLAFDEVNILTKLNELGLDSLEFVDLMMTIRDEFKGFAMPESEWHTLDTVGDILRAIN